MAFIDIRTLRTDFGFKGKVMVPSDPDFEAALLSGLWNKLQPARRPVVIVQVQDEEDVVAAVRFACACGMKITVRGGGHNWCGASLRNGGMVLDLVNLDKIIAIRPSAFEAVVQPIVSNRALQAALNAHGVAFPSGHCPAVKISGYLLSGGMSWNHGVWGSGAGSVTAIELVTAQGDRVTATATEHSDYFWAARGGGIGFFGVVLRYHLKLYPLPKAIAASVYYYPVQHVVPLADWLDGLAGDLPENVELSLLVVHAPDELAEKAAADNGKVALVTATMFAGSMEEAMSALNQLETYSSIDECLSKSRVRPTDFEALFDASGAFWPSDLRCKVDAQFYSAPLAEMMTAVKDHLITTPSPKTVFLAAIYTGREGTPATPVDAAFSATGRFYGGPWTMWKAIDADTENVAWHEKCLTLLEPYVVSHYVGESDFVRHPRYAELSYTARNWQRLAELRGKHDPEGRFFGFSDGLG